MHRRSDRAKWNSFGAPGLVTLACLNIFRLSDVVCSAQTVPATPAASVATTDGPVRWPSIHEDVRFASEKDAPFPSKVQVFEDGEEQPDLILEQETGPVSIIVVIDVSASMKNSAKASIAAAKQMIAASNPEDEFEIVTFSWPTYVEEPFTTDRHELSSVLEGIKFEKGSSAMFDALDASLKQFEDHGARQIKALVVISDGADNTSKISLGKFLRTLKSPSSPLMYAICLNPEGRSGPANLEAMTAATGGLAFFPANEDQRQQQAIGIIRDMHSRYRLDYTSTHVKRDGRLHKVEVRLQPTSGSSKVRAIYKQEYYAPSQ